MFVENHTTGNSTPFRSDGKLLPGFGRNPITPLLALRLPLRMFLFEVSSGSGCDPETDTVPRTIQVLGGRKPGRKEREAMHVEGHVLRLCPLGKRERLPPPGPRKLPFQIQKKVFQLDVSKYNHLEVRLDVYDARENEEHHLFVKLDCHF